MLACEVAGRCSNSTVCAQPQVQLFQISLAYTVLMLVAGSRRSSGNVGGYRQSIEFLLFVKEKLPFGTDPQKDEWISAQATRAMETFAPGSYGLVPGVIDIVCWRGLEFTSTVYVPSFRSSSFVDAPEQDPAAFPRRL